MECVVTVYFTLLAKDITWIFNDRKQQKKKKWAVLVSKETRNQCGKSSAVSANEEPKLGFKGQYYDSYFNCGFVGNMSTEQPGPQYVLHGEVESNEALKP
jgi:hypothetical protein